MNYLSAENLSKAYHGKILFEHLSFGFNEGQKVSLIGVNGCGKSSLLKILAGKDMPDTGKVSTRNGIALAFLEQDPHFDPELTVDEVVYLSDKPELQVLREYEQLVNHPNADATKMQEVMARMDTLKVWEYELKFKQILSQLQVNFLDKKVGTLSGGQKKRLALAKTLIDEPDFIIMDEPTNHLDLDSIEWLEKHLSTSRQTLLMVTHDRYFLDSVSNEILELHGGKLFHYAGNYNFYLEKKAEREELLQVTTERAKSLYKKELEWLRRSPKARRTKSKSRIKAAHELKEKTKRPSLNQLQFEVESKRLGGKIIELEEISMAYGKQKILDNFSYIFKRKDRVGVVGPNGVGKTTFLKIITGDIFPDEGEVIHGQTVEIAYYRQSGMKFKPKQRVIDVIQEVAEKVQFQTGGKEFSPAELLLYFNFPKHMHYSQVDLLSGGEKRRLYLLRLLTQNPNFLILDEPTNDLDLITLARLEEFLADFKGCLMIVSHDRFFMDRLVDHSFVFEGDGKIKDFPGTYSQYREWKEEQEKEAAKVEKEAKPVKEKPKSNRARKLSYNEQREFDALEKELPKLEARKAELVELMGSGSTDYEQLNAWTNELEDLQDDLDEKEMRWLELEEIASGG